MRCVICVKCLPRSPPVQTPKRCPGWCQAGFRERVLAAEQHPCPWSDTQPHTRSFLSIPPVRRGQRHAGSSNPGQHSPPCPERARMPGAGLYGDIQGRMSSKQTHSWQPPRSACPHAGCHAPTRPQTPSSLQQQGRNLESMSMTAGCAAAAAACGASSRRPAPGVPPA